MKFLVVFAVIIGCILGMIEAISTADFEATLILGAVLAGIFLVLRMGKNKLFKM